MLRNTIVTTLLIACWVIAGCEAPPAGGDNGGGGVGDSCETEGGCGPAAPDSCQPGLGGPGTGEPGLGGGFARVIDAGSTGCETCDEDASGSVVLNINTTDRFDVPATCLNISEFLVRQDATISVTNTHATRTIKIAAIRYTESDKQDLPRGSCEGDNLLSGQTVEECINSTVGGCDHALSGPTTGFSSFLLPGETSLEVPYICSSELTFPGSGPCGEQEIETRTENWIIQAVFCNNAAAAEANFCSVLDPIMKEQGLPGSAEVWTPVENNGCP